MPHFKRHYIELVCFDKLNPSFELDKYPIKRNYPGLTGISIVKFLNQLKDILRSVYGVYMNKESLVSYACLSAARHQS